MGGRDEDVPRPAPAVFPARHRARLQSSYCALDIYFGGVPPRRWRFPCRQVWGAARRAMVTPPAASKRSTSVTVPQPETVGIGDPPP